MFTSGCLDGIERALIIGLGGGNDVISAALVALYCHRAGVKHTDIATPLSVKTRFLFDGKFEQVINYCGMGMTQQAYLDAGKEKQPMLAHLPEILQSHSVNIGKVVAISMRFGMAALVEGLTKLVSDGNYDIVIGVDVGGDCCASGVEETILSPFQDASMLYALKLTRMRSMFIEFGLCSDGELNPDGARAVVQELEENALLHFTSRISIHDPEIQKIEKVYSDVCKYRAGNTVRNVLKCLKMKDEGDTEPYHSTNTYSITLGGKRFDLEWSVDVPNELFDQVFGVCVDDFVTRREGKTMFSYRNYLDAYSRWAMFGKWQNELDGCVLEWKRLYCH